MDIKKNDFYNLILGILQIFILNLQLRYVQYFVPIWFRYLSENQIRFAAILFFISSVFMFGNFSNLAVQLKTPKDNSYYNVAMLSVITLMFIFANFVLTIYMLRGKI